MYKRIPKSNDFLYHYTSYENFKAIMEGMSLRFNYFKKMNDPKESKYWSCSINKEDVKKYIYNPKRRVEKEYLNLYTSFNINRIKPFQDMKMKIQVLSFTTDNPDFQPGIDENNAFPFRGFGNPMHYLFSKTTFWEPEREYRLALFNEVEEHIFLDITDCIASIIVGKDIETEKEDEIIEISKTNKISVSKIDWGNGYPTAYEISSHKTQYKYE